MVKVFKKDAPLKETIAIGEIIKEDKKTFKLHTTNIVFLKKEYHYQTAD